MQPLNHSPQTPRLDPAPSRWSWRLQRLMLTPVFSFGLRVGLPFVLTFGIGLSYLSNPVRQNAISDVIANTRASIQERPEFMVSLLAIDGAGTVLAEDIRRNLPIDFPVSSFDLDLEQMRETVMLLSPVAEASLRIRPGGVLQVDVVPRVPVVVWRSHTSLSLLDANGAHVAHVSFRSDRADLPLIAGEGANEHVDEAVELIRTAQPLGKRLRGVVRIGARRWDIVLDRDQRILLPTTGAVTALERVIALEGAQDVLSRDIARIDMRLSGRPTVKMNDEATQELWRIRQIPENGQ